MINWNFPSNNHGQRAGLNDAGIETFKSSPLNSLAREIIQNSCDAKNHQIDKPVEVHFTLETINTSDFPDKNNYIDILNACKKFWENDTKTINFFNEALKKINGDKLFILKISDYNTTGLQNAGQDRIGEWQNLIKSVGSSNKDAGSGGSFGIGKNAPFACSSLRTVFYGTKDIKGIQAFQGVSKLVTHESLDEIETQGTGYYGESGKNSPILDPNQIHEFFKRDEIGTDVFVSGFDMDKDWESKIIKSVLENFFIAILDKKLVAKIGENEINDQTISEYLEKYTKNDKECLSYKYYESYTLSNVKRFYEKNFENLGEIEFHVLIGNDMPKKVAMMRSTGMKIYDKGAFRTVSKFAGVLIVKGDQINEFLRLIEPPAHDAWEPERHEDPKYAKSIIKKLYKWMSENIKSITLDSIPEMLDVEGLNEYLPDDHENGTLNQSNSEYGEKSIPKEIKIISNPLKIKNPTFEESEKENAKENKGRLDNQGNQSHYENALVPSNKANGKEKKDSDPGARKSNNDGHSKDIIIDDSEVNNNAKNKSSENILSKNLKLTQKRVFCVDSNQGLYKVSLRADRKGLIDLSFRIKGELDGEIVEIKSAILFDSKQELTLSNDHKRILTVPFMRGSKTELEISLKETDRYALEVIMYVN
ncbi:hypothetical protein PO903_09795 [Paenibacillus sp. PK4536]|uniref:hypothetical protein n=1 Tax=Paenibacillus sp. PK4536 TaxID=3024576 RepID=UPI0023585676|nr:hypothetical protein [Paenibacillus sp. PK4536]WIM41137.1 hypothetical protein PO903_09795 [Paenibacillus sp. PK4536]